MLLLFRSILSVLFRSTLSVLLLFRRHCQCCCLEVHCHCCCLEVHCQYCCLEVHCQCCCCLEVHCHCCCCLEVHCQCCCCLEVHCQCCCLCLCFSLIVGYDATNGDHHKLLSSILMTCSDLLSGTKEWEWSRRISDLVYTEFFTQGDMEKTLGKTPSEMMDRNKARIPEQQLGFLDNISGPAYK